MALPGFALRGLPRLAVAFLACQLFTSAPGATIRDGGIDPANLGKGDWIYILPNALNQMGGNVSSVTNLSSMMMFLKNQGLRYLIIKAASGPTLYPSDSAPQFTAEVVNAGHAAGLWVFGYNRSDGTDIPGEIAVAEYVFNTGADGFVFDAEIEWESQNLPDNTTKAMQLCSTVRSNWPTKFLAHSPFPLISYHSTFPYKEFGYYCDAVMPQDYWIEIGVTPTSMVQQMTSQFRTWQNGLSGKWTNSIKPIVAVGQGWTSTSGTVTAAQVTEFVSALKTQASPATAGGYKGVNYFRAELHPLEVWDAIRTNGIGNFPLTNPPVISNVSADNETANGATITWTTDQSSDSVVEYGLDTSYGNAVTNSTPLYYHTVVLSGLSPSTTYYYRVKSKNSNSRQGVSDVNVFGTTAITVADVIVESQNGGKNYANYSENGVYPNGWQNSTAKSGAAGCTAGIGSRFNSNAAIGGASTWFQVSPTLAVAEASYEVFVTTVAPAGYNVTSTITDPTGTGWTGLPATTTAFSSVSQNQWVSIGTLTLRPGQTVATVRFDETANNNRFYADAVKFVYVPPPAVAPVIVTQPQSQVYTQGNTASFSVVVSGTAPLHYQWRRNGTNLSGAILSGYTRNNVQPGDAGSYSVVITNNAGGITSNPALLTVVVPPSISAQPQGATTNAGANVRFSVAADGSTPLSYQWQLNAVDIPGATASTYTRTNVQGADAGSYSVTVSNMAGMATSEEALLVVLLPTPPHIDSISLLPDRSIRLEMSGGPGSFAIEATPALSGGWAQVTNFTAPDALFQYTEPPSSETNRYYRVRVLP